MAHKRRSVLFFPLIVLTCSMIGGIYGPHVAAAAATSDDDVKNSVRNFTKMYDLVEQNFADPLSPDKAIYQGAIPGMLRTLDPHSNFFDPKAFQLMREEQRGHYYGVGMTVQGRNGKTVVLAPFADAPSYKAGIRPGDVITAVNGKSTDNLTTNDVADMLKGPRGTTVRITILREGTPDPLNFDVVRDEINRRSVIDPMWLKAGIAYIHVELFNENTSKEMEDDLQKLGEAKMKGLILDLRDNPGGLLNEAVAVADHFLPKGHVIVSHHGRSSQEKVYRAENGNQGRDYPIVVLVNRFSASASEIVSGALQDHDRAWILGDNTFGKGLVQTVYPLQENTALALTTAKYYTPSGRLIQRDYTNVSFFDYYYKTNTEARNLQDVKMTDGGRTVYGGGGISPDQKYIPPKLDRFESELLRKYAMFNFTRNYFGTRSTKLPKDWSPDEAVLTEFHDYLLKQNLTFTEAEFTQDQDWIKHSLEREFYTTAFSIDASHAFDVQTDPAVKLAVDALPKAEALLNTAKKIIVQRMAH